MTTCLVGLQYLPSVEYFAHWIHHEEFMVEANEHYQKKTWRNKTAILSGNGILPLSVPLTKGKHHEKQIRDVTISYNEPWHKIHFFSIQAAYGKTAFFEEIEAELKTIFFNQPSHLWQLNLELLTMAKELTGIAKSFKLSENFEKVPGTGLFDLRKGVEAGRPFSEKEILPVYQQIHRFGKPFIPNLSILDVLCHLGPATYEYLLQYKQKMYPTTT